MPSNEGIDLYCVTLKFYKENEMFYNRKVKV